MGTAGGPAAAHDGEGISFCLCVHFRQNFLAGALNVVLNDVVGLGEVSGLQGCQQPLMVIGGYLLLGAGVAGKKVVGHDELALNAVIDLTETAVPGLFHQYPVEIQIGAPGLDDVGRLVGGYTLPRQTLQRLKVHGQELVLDIRQRLMLQQQPHLDDIADLLLTEGGHGEVSLAGKDHHALGMHPFQGLLDGGPTDAVALRQLVQIQRLSRLPVAL